MFERLCPFLVLCCTRQLFQVAANLPNTSLSTTTKETLYSTGCDESWYRFQDSCYKVFIDDEYYQDARQICLLNKAVLVTIQSNAENAYIKTLATTFTKYNGAWIGLRKVSGEFLWNDKGKVDEYDNWLLDKPSKGTGSCVQIIASGYWNNINCFNRIPLLCKKDKNPPAEVSNLELILNISIPLSCVFIMFCFVSFLCYKSYSELNDIQAEDFDGKPFELVQAAMVLPITRAPDLMTSNGKNLWKNAIERLKEEQIKNNPFNQLNTFQSRSSDQLASNTKPEETTDKNSSFADIVQSLMTKKKDSYADGTLGLPIINNPNVPSICVDRSSEEGSTENIHSSTEHISNSRVKIKTDDSSGKGKWYVDVSTNLQGKDIGEIDNRIEIKVDVNRENKQRKNGTVVNGNILNDQKINDNNNDDDVISNKNCTTIDDNFTDAEKRLSRGEFRDSLRRESLRRKDKYFPNSPEKKNSEAFPVHSYETRDIAADYSFVTLV